MNGSPQCSVPSWDSPKSHAYLSLPFPLILATVVEHKIQRSRAEIRTIYCKKQWDKKTNCNSNGIKTKSVWERVIDVQNAHWARSSPARVDATPLLSLTWDCHHITLTILAFIAKQKPCPFNQKSKKPLPLVPRNDVRWYQITSGSWPCLLSHFPSQQLQKINTVLGWNQGNCINLLAVITNPDFKVTIDFAGLKYLFYE